MRALLESPALNKTEYLIGEERSYVAMQMAEREDAEAVKDALPLILSRITNLFHLSCRTNVKSVVAALAEHSEDNDYELPFEETDKFEQWLQEAEKLETLSSARIFLHKFLTMRKSLRKWCRKQLAVEFRQNWKDNTSTLTNEERSAREKEISVVPAILAPRSVNTSFQPKSPDTKEIGSRRPRPEAAAGGSEETDRTDPIFESTVGPWHPGLFAGDDDDNDNDDNDDNDEEDIDVDDFHDPLDDLEDGAEVQVSYPEEMIGGQQPSTNLDVMRRRLIAEWLGLTDSPSGSQLCRLCEAQVAQFGERKVIRSATHVYRHMGNVHGSLFDDYLNLCFGDTSYVCRLCKDAGKKKSVSIQQRSRFAKHLRTHHPAFCKTL